MGRKRGKGGSRGRNHKPKRQKLEQTSPSPNKIKAGNTWSEFEDEAAVREAEQNQKLGNRSFPTTWTADMKQFYGAIRGFSLDVSQSLSKQNRKCEIGLKRANVGTGNNIILMSILI